MKMRKRRPVHPVLTFILLLGLSPASLFAAEATKAYNKQYAFTVNTFTDKIPAWTKLLSEFKGKPGINYLEIGTFEGRSALWMLENILTHPTSTLTIIDLFAENNYKTFTSNVKLSGEASKFKIMTGSSTDKIREIPFNSIDLAYIDGSGRGIIMFSDLVSTWNLVKVGGLIICSRYSLTPHLRRALNLQADDPGPHEAIDTFLKIYKTYVSVVTFQGNYVIVRKNRE
jgi:predicted O-methyltransferase YrrM